MKKLYHGSENTFNAFSLDYLGKNGTAQGSGVYLASNKETAAMYGDNLYTVTVKIENDLKLDSMTITRAKLKAIVKELHNSHDLLNDFNDVNYYGVNYVLNECLDLLLEDDENDTDLYNGLVNIVGDTQAVTEVFYKHGKYTHVHATDQTRLKDDVFIILDPRNVIIENVEKA